MNVRTIIITAFALWLAATVVGGVRVAEGLGGLQHIGTLLVVAMVFSIVDALAAGARRAIRLLIEPLPLTVAAVVAFNGLLVWLTAGLAGAAGLAFAVDGFLPALLAWLIVGACRGTFLSPRAV
jgi:uncharacterized membrane protein YvlD (DUF360 family)